MAKFVDSQGRDWTVRITGETICAASARGIDIEMEQIVEAAQSGSGLALANIKFLGQFIELCWLGCAHNSRVQAGKVDESGFKQSICGAALIPAILATAEALCEAFGLKVEPLAEGESKNPTAPESKSSE